MPNGWGGARPGAGRKPAAAAPAPDNVIPFEGRRPTLGEALNALRPAAPATPTPATPGGPAPPAPPLGTPPPAPLPPSSPAWGPPPENQMFADVAGFVAPAIAVVAFTKSIEKDGKLRVRDVDPDAMEKAADITSRSIVRALGNTEVPWWAGLALAYANLYLNMRMGAERIDAPVPKQAGLEQAAAAAASSPAGPLGQAPQRKPPAPPPPPRPAPAPGLSRLPTIQPTAI